MDLDNQVMHGTWLYDGAIPCAIYIIRRNIAYGSGDPCDSKEVREDRNGKFYYVLSEAAGEPGVIKSEVGPFETIEESKQHVNTTTNNTIRWK